MKFTPLRFAATGLFALFAACQTDTHAPRQSPVISVPAGGVQAVIEQAVDTTAGNRTFIVRVLSNEVSVSAFQGRVTFDAGAFELVHHRAPAAAPGQTFIINTDSFPAGVIRFAAFTITQFDSATVAIGTEAFRFTVRENKPAADAHLVATLDVVGTNAGASVAPDRILASPGIIQAGAR